MANEKTNEELVAAFSAVLQKTTAEQRAYVAGMISTLEAVAVEQEKAAKE